MTGMMVYYEKPPIPLVRNNLTMADCMEIYKMYRKGANPGHIGKLYGIKGARVSRIIKIEAAEEKARR